MLRDRPHLVQAELPCPGSLTVPGWRITCEPAREIVNTADTFTVAVSGKLVLRPRQSGDEMRLSGGTKSLKKLLIDRKVPAADRMHIPIIADDAGILGVYGVGVNWNRTAEQLPAVTIKIERDGG